MSKAFVVVSNIKKHIKEKAGMNTSQEVVDKLNDDIERLIERAIDSAKSDGRKTVMGRDIGNSLPS